MAQETTIYHVVPDGDEWAVKKQGHDQASRTAATKKEAVEHAKTFAKRQAPSRIVVHREDGLIQEQISYEHAPRSENAATTILTTGPVLTGLALALGVTGLVWFLAQRD